jgi:hypothetical protein
MSGFTPEVPYGLMPREGFAVAVVGGSVFLQATAPTSKASIQTDINLNLMALVTLLTRFR